MWYIWEAQGKFGVWERFRAKLAATLLGDIKGGKITCIWIKSLHFWFQLQLIKLWYSSTNFFWDPILYQFLVGWGQTSPVSPVLQMLPAWRKRQQVLSTCWVLGMGMEESGHSYPVTCPQPSKTSLVPWQLLSMPAYSNAWVCTLPANT